MAGEFTTQDIEYLRHGDRALSIRLFRPLGPGPFPVVIDIHGGGWCSGKPAECHERDGTLAGAGIAAATLEFRHAGDGYPTSLIDINYAVRWMKAHGADHGIDGARIGLAGQSSGGHLAMLAGMRPGDPRYGAVALEGGHDATVKAVAMLWPVINPLSRYRHALRSRAATPPAGWVGDLPERHDLYWKTEAAMEEGNPVLALEKGEDVSLPPAIWVQGRPDPVHDYLDPENPEGDNEPERFARLYKAAGGAMEICDIEYATRLTRPSVDPLIAFFGRHL